MARGTVVASQARLDEGLCVVVWIVLSVTSLLRSALRELLMAMMLLAKRHNLRGVALHWQPQQHEGEHESGQEQFHRDQVWR